MKTRVSSAISAICLCLCSLLFWGCAVRLLPLFSFFGFLTGEGKIAVLRFLIPPGLICATLTVLVTLAEPKSNNGEKMPVRFSSLTVGAAFLMALMPFLCLLLLQSTLASSFFNPFIMLLSSVSAVCFFSCLADVFRAFGKSRSKFSAIPTAIVSVLVLLLLLGDGLCAVTGRPLLRFLYGELMTPLFSLCGAALFLLTGKNCRRGRLLWFASLICLLAMPMASLLSVLLGSRFDFIGGTVSFLGTALTVTYYVPALKAKKKHTVLSARESETQDRRTS